MLLSKNTIIETLKTEKPYLQKEFGVDEIGLFGSYARGEQNENSDIDILVKLRQPKYLWLAGLHLFLEEKFGKKVELVRLGDYLGERFLNRIKNDIVYV